MTVPDKKLAPGEIRFLARKVDKFWRVYDRVRGSFPYHNKDLGGKVLQDVGTEKEAQVEADRLNEQFVEQVSKKTKTSPRLEPVEEGEKTDNWISEEDIPDYGVMDEEKAKKYVEGIL